MALGKEKAMDVLKLFGNAPHLVVAAREGLTRAGIREDEVDDDFATFAGGDGKALVRDAALRFGLPLAKARGRIADFFDLGENNFYLVEEYVYLDVDYALAQGEIDRRANLAESDWEYIGTPPTPGKRTVKAAIGRLSCSWTERQVTGLLAKPGCPLRGSGAWVCETYLEGRPNYDGKGWMAFPDAATSRWQHRLYGGIRFPYLWGIGRRWNRDRRHVESGLDASVHLCLLVSEVEGC